MADEKISAMPAATSVGNADLLPIVQGGVNKRATKILFLTQSTGEPIGLVGPGVAIIRIDSAGGLQLTAEAGQPVQILVGTSGLYLSPSGDSVLQASLAHRLVLSSYSGLASVVATGTEDLILSCLGGGTLEFNHNAAIVMNPNVGSVINIAYQDGTVGAWAVGPPSTIREAVDRLATAVAGLLGVPIP